MNRDINQDFEELKTYINFYEQYGLEYPNNIEFKNHLDKLIRGFQFDYETNPSILFRSLVQNLQDGLVVDVSNMNPITFQGYDLIQSNIAINNNMFWVPQFKIASDNLDTFLFAIKLMDPNAEYLNNVAQILNSGEPLPRNY